MKRMYWVIICLFFCAATGMAQPKQQERLIRDTYAEARRLQRRRSSHAKRVYAEGRCRGCRSQVRARRFPLGRNSGDSGRSLTRRWSRCRPVTLSCLLMAVMCWIAGRRKRPSPQRGSADSMRPCSIRNGPSPMCFTSSRRSISTSARYTSYQVTVRLEGRSRTYRALALFRGSSHVVAGVLGCDRQRCDARLAREAATV